MATYITLRQDIGNNNSSSYSDNSSKFVSNKAAFLFDWVKPAAVKDNVFAGRRSASALSNSERTHFGTDFLETKGLHSVCKLLTEILYFYSIGIEVQVCLE